MKKLSLLVFSFLLLIPMNAQDLIGLKSGKTIEAKIINVDKDRIRYIPDNDPLYEHTVNISDVLMIKYESGKVERFSIPQPYGNKQDALSMDIVPYMKYSQLKGIYNPQNYRRSYMDRFNPNWIGIASFLMPGLGECICDEWGRGLGKFAGMAACTTAGTLFAMRSYVDTNWRADIALAVVFYVAAFSFDIWSVVDAVKISKVRNMYESDMRVKYAIDMDLSPSINCMQIGNRIQPTVGLTLAMRF